MKTLIIGINSKYIHPAMGAFQIYTNSIHPIELKEFTIKDNKENIIEFINKQDFDILAFSVYIWNISFIHSIISELKHIKTIILGGPEASYRPNDFLKYPNVQYIIKDEGEEAFNKLISELKGNKDFSKVPNLYYKDGNQYKFTYPKKPNIKNIKYDYSLIKDFKNRVVYLEASRGCCFRCAYCLASLEKTIRYLDFDLVKEHILFALKNGARVIKFLDRSFNINVNYTEAIIKFLKEHNNNYTVYQFEVVGDLLDKKIIELLKTVRRGQIRFEIGIQSLNETVTRAVNRTQNLFKLIENINAIKDNIIIHLDLIAGLPYEDKASFINTFNKTFEIFPDELQLGFLKELQGTEISLTKDIHEYIFEPNPPYEVIENKYISSKELDEIRLVESGLNKFYNSGNYPRTINYLFKELKLDPYHTFLKIVNFIGKTNLNKLQFDEVTIRFYYSLIDLVPNPEYLFFIIKQDYLSKFNIRPKIFWMQTISRKERKIIYEKFISEYPNLNIDTLYRYGHLEKYNNTYFLIIYNAQKAIYILKN